MIKLTMDLEQTNQAPDRLIIRAEEPDDVDQVKECTRRAFIDAPYSDQREHLILDALRASDALIISLVATAPTDPSKVLGHVAISPVTLSTGEQGWYGLGPISVLPDYQKIGIGSKLVRAALEQLERQGAKGCVLLGSHAYYSRFGFEVRDGLVYKDAPKEHFLAVSFGGEFPIGEVKFHPAFEAVDSS